KTSLRAEQLRSACCTAESGLHRVGGLRRVVGARSYCACRASGAGFGPGEAILVPLSNSGAYISTIQGSSGSGWSALKTIVNPQTSTIVSDLASDDAGRSNVGGSRGQWRH